MTEVATLSAGQSFGELALISQKPRAATIRCLENCHFAVLSKQDYEKVLGKKEQALFNKMTDFLRSMPIFMHWTKNALLKLTYYFKKREFQRKQWVYKEGESCENVYIVE